MAGPLRVARRVGANVAAVARRGLARAALPPGANAWLLLRVTAPVEELAPPRLPFAGEPAPGLLELLDALEAAASDARIGGVLVRLAAPVGSRSRAAALRRALERIRQQGKPVVLYAESLDAEGLLVASAATRVWLPETGNLFLVGLRAESLFFGELLERLEVRAEVVRIGSHKTAAERFTRDRMSPEEREQLETLVGDLYDDSVSAIAQGRGLEDAQLRDLIDRGPYTAPAAREAGLIDACLYPDEIEAQLERLTPLPPDAAGPRRVRLVDWHVYAALGARDARWRPLLRELPHLAYVVMRGGIHRGRGSRGIASDTWRELFERLRTDAELKGVVLRLESPGGEGLASDLLWRSVSLLNREKPVVVSMGDVAASGAYYLAAAADTIVAESATVTGSIGVVGGKLNLEGLLERVGVRPEAVERGARAGLLSAARGFTGDERAAVRAEMSALYAAFVERVARGRKLEPAAVERVAQGRVWSGARALTLGLVDAIGGPLEALLAARRRAGLGEQERVLIDVHPRRAQIPALHWLRRLPGRMDWL